jgi:hypothetical protein
MSLLSHTTSSLTNFGSLIIHLVEYTDTANGVTFGSSFEFRNLFTYKYSGSDLYINNVETGNQSAINMVL